MFILFFEEESVTRLQLFSCTGDLPQFYSGCTLHLHDEVKNSMRLYEIRHQLAPVFKYMCCKSIYCNTNNIKRWQKWPVTLMCLTIACVFIIWQLWIDSHWTPVRPQSNASNLNLLTCLWMCLFSIRPWVAKRFPLFWMCLISVSVVSHV